MILFGKPFPENKQANETRQVKHELQEDVAHRAPPPQLSGADHARQVAAPEMLLLSSAERSFKTTVTEKLQMDALIHTRVTYVRMCTPMFLHTYDIYTHPVFSQGRNARQEKSRTKLRHKEEPKELAQLHFLLFQGTDAAHFVSTKHCEPTLKEKPKTVRVGLDYH